MRVYRVEHAVSHYGPYSHFDYTNPSATERLRNALHLASITPRHPIPEEDPKLEAWTRLSLKEQQDEYIFGFASREQLLAWFDNAALRDHLHTMEFIVAEYEALDVYVGGQQVIFHKSAARIITYPILNLYAPSQPDYAVGQLQGYTLAGPSPKDAVSL